MTDELPPGWAVTRLESLIGPEGLMTDGDWVESKDQDPNGEIRLVQLADVGDGVFLDKSNRFLTQAKAEELDCTFLQTRDVLISRLGEPLGKTCLFPELEQPCVTVVDVHVVRPTSSEISREWLVHLLNSAPVRRVVDAQSSGTTRKRITGQKLKDLEVRVAPAPEQQRIASKIDELFSRIDEGERALERVQKLVERYRQSVLKAAVTGELTRDWREKNKDQLETGEALLARILKARREAWQKAELDKMKAKGITPANDKWKQRYEEPAAPSAHDLPPLPENWTYVSVEQLCFVDTGATPKRGEARYFKDGTINWITSTAVNEAVILEASERITQAAINETNAKVFPVGSFIVAMYGEGKTRGRIAELGIAAATNQACAALICGHLDPHVKAYVRTFFEKNYAALRATAAGGVQPNLNLGILKRTSLPLPPLAEIKAINDVSAAGLSQASAIAAEFASWERRSVALRQKILAAAFTGELVSQESGDEPASELLERIAAGRTGSAATPKRGRKPKTSEPV